MSWKRSNWKYETSEDTTISVIASVSVGRFILKNVVTNETMSIRYRCLAAGFSKGLPVGYTESKLRDESKGTHIHSLGFFDPSVFPCHGYMIGLGATLGVLDSNPGPPNPDFANGGGYGVVIFELFPFARFACQGQFRATTPGAGVSLGLASFTLGD
jgi:hypothetical protein